MKHTSGSEVQSLINFDTGYADFQMDYYISGRAGKTAYGIFKQACLEMQTRYYNLFDMHCDLAIAKEELDQENHDIKKLKKQMEIRGKEKQIQKVEREITRFYQQAVYLDRTYNFSQMTHNDREKEEYKMWIVELKEKIGNDLWDTAISTDSGFIPGKVSSSVRGLIRNCPPEIRNELNDSMYVAAEKVKLMVEFKDGLNFNLPAELPKVEFNQTKILDFIGDFNDE